MAAMRRGPCRIFRRLGSFVSLGAALFFQTAGAADTARPAAAPGRVAVAAAANFVYALDALQTAYREGHPDTEVTITTAASGTLVAQIVHGAPYDVFLSADVDYPRALIATGQGVAASLRVFAVGRLVLWTQSAEVPLDPATAVRSARVRRLAIANVDSAPYGRAARSALQSLGMWEAAQPKLVIGENITQTAQFVETGSADAGFVALSLVLSPRLERRGRWAMVPADLYPPLAHGAVLTRRGAANPAAADWLAFLTSARAREILARYGYLPPP